jgi:RimJ/RimL family protein N-acetyltransferase
MIELAKAVKDLVDGQAKFPDWNKRDDIKSALKVGLILLLDEFGYPPVERDEVYVEIFEQAENFKKNLADFTPCIDIGWRIKYSEWNKGFATEGAIKCLDYAFEALKIEEIFSIAPKINLKSTHIMAKIGLKKQNEFEHPLLKNDARLKTCVLYKAKNIF